MGSRARRGARAGSKAVSPRFQLRSKVRGVFKGSRGTECQRKKKKGKTRRSRGLHRRTPAGEAVRRVGRADRQVPSYIKRIQENRKVPETIGIRANGDGTETRLQVRQLSYVDVYRRRTKRGDERARGCTWEGTA